jgi:hypothetical protein
MITENGLQFRARRHHLFAPGPDGWAYVIELEWHTVGYGRKPRWPKRDWYSVKRWHAYAGGAIHYTIRLGTWKTFAQAQAACEEHAIRSRVS